MNDEFTLKDTIHMGTVYLEIRSGIGNQLFQFAFGYYLSKRYNFKLVCCPLHYPGSLKYMIKKMLGKEVRDFVLPLMIEQNFVVCSSEAIKKKLVADNVQLIQEENFSEEEFAKLAKLQDNIYLSGYWQNTDFVKDLQTEISKLLKPDIKFSKAYQQLAASIDNRSVAIHIRRGDFLTNKAFGACTKEYYLTAMDKIRERVPNARFIVFSNDPKWALKNFGNTAFEVYSSQLRSHGDVEEFFLLSQFKNIIISNSTFSWWAAFINGNDKMVVSPSRWFLKESMVSASEKLFVPGWEIINNNLELAQP